MEQEKCTCKCCKCSGHDFEKLECGCQKCKKCGQYVRHNMFHLDNPWDNATGNPLPIAWYKSKVTIC